MNLLRTIILFLAAGAVSASPFQNGDFQNGYAQTITLLAGDSRIPGWEIGGDGSVVWEEGEIRFPGPQPKVEWIQQTFDTIPNHRYRVIFGLFHVGDGGGPSAVATDIKSATGQSLLSTTNLLGNITGILGFGDITVEFTATTMTTSLRITHNYSSDATREARIDNVRLFDLSAGPSLAAALFPGVYIEGQVGLNYELQYSDLGQPEMWRTVATFHLDASPKLLLVETNLAPSHRTYRAVLVP